jgi:phytanoyl-CoA hydroxylase
MGKIQISEKDKAFFFEEGYLVLENILDEADLQPVIDEITSEIDIRAQKLRDAGDISELHEHEPFETRLARISQETAKLAVSIWNGILHGPAIFHLITNPKLLDIAEAFCGEELIASSVYRLRPKIPEFGYGVVPAHQDSGYFEPICDDSLIITMWIPLVDTNRENGCLYVIPRSHQGTVVEHVMHDSGKYLAIRDDVLPETEAVYCPVPKGGILLLSNKVIHGSHPNRTRGVRWSKDLRYQSANLPTNADISRLEQESAEDMDAGVPSACYPPDPDFLVRSKVRKNEILDSPEAFRKLRESFRGKPASNRFGVHWKEMGTDEIE